MKKILVKINDEKFLKYPVDGFILGVLNYSNCFSISFSFEEIEKIALENKDKEIFVSLNKVIKNDELDDYKSTLKKLDSLNLKGIIVGDVAALTYDLKTDLILDQAHLNNSSLTINHYYNNGVNGMVLTNDITLDEINYISKNTEAILFKQVFGLPHLSTSQRKLASNYLEYFNIKDNSKSYLIKEDDKDEYYHVVEDKFGTHILGSKVLNLFDKIDDINVDYFILDGYLLDKEKFEETVSTFLKKDKNSNEKIKQLFDTDEGFINKKTMYKVKNNE